MDERTLTGELSGTWNETQAARDALVARGAAVVPAVLGLLCDEASPVDWLLPSDVLRRVGEPALRPLVRAAENAGSREAARRVAFTLSGVEVADIAAYLPLLDHPHTGVRTCALSAFKGRGEAAAGFADRLIPLLGDRDGTVRERAVLAFRAIGTAAVPELRRVRRSPAPAPRVRAGALEALAAIGGPAALDDRDRAAWRRLTAVRLAAEPPAAMHASGCWYAVPTTDQDAVLAAFDLSDAEPATLRTGEAAWIGDQGRVDRHPHERCARVFVSPSLDGWTLVFGDTAQDTHRVDDADDPEAALPPVVRERCAELSRRFGSAQWYGTSCADGWTAWCIAEDGEVVRHYDWNLVDEDGGDESGDDAPGHPAEAGYLLPHQYGFPAGAYDGVDPCDTEAFLARHRQLKEELGIPDTCDANVIAARLSVDPGGLGPHLAVTGHGVLALTACGRRHGHPAGALPV
ncbi:HEAT repeat domain-containing protein [Kitasatospora sp. NPDC094028]